MNNLSVMSAPNENSNPFAVQQNGEQASSMAAVANGRAAQEVQAAMVVAKKFPRNESMAYERIMSACQRKGLAEASTYEYSRGGTAITGPSIRLAEVLARAWGNMEIGIIELEQRIGESDVMAFAWDLETNMRQTKTFLVKHERHTKSSGVKKLTDPRDIYETVANQGARRLRACILGVIPGDVVDAALDQCQKTLTSGNTEPLIDRIRKMVGAFNEFNVTVAMLEKFLGHKLEAISEQKFAKLRRIYCSLKDGIGKREDFFNPDADQPAVNTGDDEGEADFRPQAPSGQQASSPATPATPSALKAPDLREEFIAASRAAGIPDESMFRYLQQNHALPPHITNLIAALGFMHGKTVKTVAAKIPSIAALLNPPATTAPAQPQEPSDPLGPESDTVKRVKAMLDEKQFSVATFLEWGSAAGHFNEVTDMREIPTPALDLIIANWVKYVPQLMLVSR